MGIKDESNFRQWYNEYKTYAPIGEDDQITYGSLEEKVKNIQGMSLSEFQRHLAEALMAGYAMGWIEGQHSCW